MIDDLLTEENVWDRLRREGKHIDARQRDCLRADAVREALS